MASNPFIESHRMCIVFPLSNDSLIENGNFGLKHKRNQANETQIILARLQFVFLPKSGSLLVLFKGCLFFSQTFIGVAIGKCIAFSVPNQP